MDYNNLNENTDLNQKLSLLKQLSSQYPNIDCALTEIINLKAILNLPKGTEHFLSDLHGEYESFTHVLRNASGVIKAKIDLVFGSTLCENDKRTLATLIYYPKEKLEIEKKKHKNIYDWYKVNLYRLIELTKVVSSKYTRSKVRKALPKDFGYIIEELINEQSAKSNKVEYYHGIIHSIIEYQKADDFIIAISKLIQRLSIDKLHIVGDIYDRGPGADKIVELLMDHHSVDIQWGNHDILWIAASAGCVSSIANVLRICLRYGHLSSLEQGYGINLRKLIIYALENYSDDPCSEFYPKITSGRPFHQKDLDLFAKMHKAITILQFKLEAQIIKRHPEFEMESYLLLDKVLFDENKILIDGKKYDLKDSKFGNINKEDPFTLTKEETELVAHLKDAFTNSRVLEKHVRFILAKGSMYLIHNSNLMYHASIPIDDFGNFKEVNIFGTPLKGKALMDKFEYTFRQGYFMEKNNPQKEKALDIMWYLWCGKYSPLFGKNKMSTFERYFIKDTSLHKEEYDNYFSFRDKESMCDIIFEEFGLDSKKSHIINGHVPVSAISGENPVKANGKLIVIDGAFSKSYQKKSGVAGYTLIYNSYGLLIGSHKPFTSIEDAINNEDDILPSKLVVEQTDSRETVAQTDIGEDILNQIYNLEMLTSAYRKGLIKELSLNLN